MSTPTPLASTAMEAAREIRRSDLRDPMLFINEGLTAAIIEKHFQPLLAKVEGERDEAMEILDTVARGFDRSLGRLLIDDKAGAERELKLAIAHVDNPHGYTGKSMAQLRADLAAAKEDYERMKKAIAEKIQRIRDNLGLVVGQGLEESCTKLKADLAAKQAALSFSDAVKIARGCFDYSGGHRSDDGKLEVFHHGIQTVLNALEAGEKRAFADPQLVSLYRTGSALASRADKGGAT